ncbi:MAG: zinc ribbon domain-containing protein [Candidatus Omnitrophota bacterium]|nr:MAG: zinc ribbon domain-containing protein [Candidatus Omnitrophota bacterium]
MPTYDYECLSCRRRFEIFHKISENEERVCPSCGGKMRRLIGAGCGLIFKGSGFYITDYKKKESPSSSSPKNPKSQEEKKDKKDK